MKKFLVLMAVLLVMFAMPMTAFAEETTATETVVETEAETTAVTEETEETPSVTEVTVPSETEVYEIPEEVSSLTDRIMAYIQAHLEEISVIVTLLLSILYQIRKHASLNKSIGTLNNNAISVAENSRTAITNSSTIIDGYKSEMSILLAEYKQAAEDRKRLETALTNSENLLKTSKMANVELANEVAELLVLANIPNSKKDELYSRHRAAVDAIASAEATEATEVIEDGNTEA